MSRTRARSCRSNGRAADGVTGGMRRQGIHERGNAPRRRATSRRLRRPLTRPSRRTQRTRGRAIISALARQNLGDPEGAIASYMRAIRLDPSLIEAYINLGNLYGEMGLEEEALEVFQRALELDSGNDELFINVGDAYRSLGFFEDAILAYRQAQILNPDNTLAADNLRDVRERAATSRRRTSPTWSAAWTRIRATSTATPISWTPISRRTASRTRSSWSTR